MGSHMQTLQISPCSEDTHEPQLQIRNKVLSHLLAYRSPTYLIELD